MLRFYTFERKMATVGHHLKAHQASKSRLLPKSRKVIPERLGCLADGLAWLEESVLTERM
jgi:hypothetical protein